MFWGCVRFRLAPFSKFGATGTNMSSLHLSKSEKGDQIFRDSNRRVIERVQQLVHGLGRLLDGPLLAEVVAAHR